VVGSHEVLPDRRGERERAARLDLGVVGDVGPEHRTQELDADVVDPAQTFGDGGIVARPRAYGEVDRQQVVGEGQGTGEVHRLAHVAPLRPGDSDGVVGAAPLPHRRSHRSSPASWS